MTQMFQFLWGFLLPFSPFFLDLYLEPEGFISSLENLFKVCGQHVLDQKFQNFKFF